MRLIDIAPFVVVYIGAIVVLWRRTDLTTGNRITLLVVLAIALASFGFITRGSAP
jgi:hypothetical protein